MALQIETFSNQTGGSTFFKAAGHPLAAPRARDLIERLIGGGAVAVYDPDGFLATFNELFPLERVDLAGVFVQDVEKVGRSVLGRPAQPVTELPASPARTLLVAAFDGERVAAQIGHLIAPGVTVLSFDAFRLADALLTDRRNYLSKFNFATNFAFLREGRGQHTRLVSANYWSGYGASQPHLWLCLFGADGTRLAEWHDPMPEPGGTLVIDSQEIARRFGLTEFTGSLFIHVIGAAGHDIVKYALDTYGDDDTELSCSHDANAWPSDYYAGLPAPRPGERVVLWVQNSHPCAIPAGAIGLNLMGDPEIAWLDREIAPFATVALEVCELLPAAVWPQQFEVQAGKYFVRPRYEVIEARGRKRIAHANVERVDLRPDPKLAELGNLLGKGYILPAPILPLDRFSSVALPTPMSTAQSHLPLQVLVYDAAGQQVAARALGNLKRSDSVAVEIDELLAEAGASLPSGYGHLELSYDFGAGDCADGWLHGLFRYRNRASGHSAETSFGAHVYNTVLVYKGEPQSYAGRPPGLSTRLFLRLGPAPLDTLCHLTYPASTPWHRTSDTTLVLIRRDGVEIAQHRVAIPCRGSYLFRYHEVFGEADRSRAGDHGYVLIRDTTCRLFGFHGCINAAEAFSFDHMFGF
ncbi:MAG: hypothetical protein GC191_14175 [Azospirillum sp.]|nr:hypothetical protein [Azospirillum sp.]